MYSKQHCQSYCLLLKEKGAGELCLTPEWFEVADSESSRAERFLAGTRYFTDSGIVGSREFVRKLWQRLKSDYDNPDKSPTCIAGLAGIYSLKRLSEKIGGYRERQGDRTGELSFVISLYT